MSVGLVDYKVRVAVLKEELKHGEEGTWDWRKRGSYRGKNESIM